MLQRTVLVALALIAFSACGADEAAGNGTRRIAVIPKGTTHEFWRAVHAGALRAAQERGVEVIWKGPVKEDDRNAQIQVVEDFVTKGVDGIVLMPLDKTALVRPAEEAVSRGIPVVIGDSDLDWDGRTSFVATDNYRGGVLAGQTLVELIGGEGKVILLRYQEGSASTMNREQGFLSTIGMHEGVEVVSENQRSGATVESAIATSENLLNSFADVDGIFCPNESSTVGMMRALVAAGRHEAVHFVGFDSSDRLLAGLRDGHVDALILQDPVKIGYEGVKAIVDFLDELSVPPRIDTGVTLATRANMDEPNIAALLSPDLSILGD